MRDVRGQMYSRSTFERSLRKIVAEVRLLIERDSYCCCWSRVLCAVGLHDSSKSLSWCEQLMRKKWSVQSDHVGKLRKETFTTCDNEKWRRNSKTRVTTLIKMSYRLRKISATNDRLETVATIKIPRVLTHTRMKNIRNIHATSFI